MVQHKATTITTLDRSAAKRIGDATHAALLPVAEAFGLTLHIRGGTFDPYDGTFRPRVEFALADADRREFERNCALIGLVPTDFGGEFTNKGRRYRVTGVSPRSPKFPLVATCVDDGKLCKFPQRLADLAPWRRAI